MPEQEFDPTQFPVAGMSIRLSTRRSVRMGDDAGYKTIESEMKYDILVNPEKPIDADMARRVALYYTPLMFSKLLFDLVVQGVMSEQEAKNKISQMKSAYAFGAKARNDDSSGNGQQGNDQADLRRTGDPVSPTGEEPSTGTVLPEGKDAGVQGQTGQSDGPASTSSTTSPSNPDSSSKPEGSS